MNTRYLIPLAMPLLLNPVYAEVPQFVSATEPAIAERGPHYAVWQRLYHYRAADGSIITRTNGYVEMATGLNYEDNGQWVPSREEIELFKDGAVARQGQHKVIFAPNINSVPAIDLLTSEGKRLRSRIFGLVYFDAASGQNLLLGELKDSIGELSAPNQIIYKDAFTDIKADVRFTYTKSGFEQDIILREPPPAPESVGLAPETTRLQVWTEFYDSPAPRKTRRVLPAHQPAGGLHQPRKIEFVDEDLNFGQMRIGRGRAFSGGGNEALSGTSAPVGKEWVEVEARTFLIESANYSQLKPFLDSLPLANAFDGKPQNKALAMTKPRVSKSDIVLAAVQRPTASSSNVAIRLALGQYRPEPSVVIDYQVLNGITNDFLAQSTGTYYVSGPVTLQGTAIIEGGAVIKFAPTNNASLILQSAPVFRTAAYRPAIITARDDNTMGETISGSTGNPSGYYANPAFRGGYFETYQHLKIAYANVGLFFDDDVGTVRHCQFINCNTAIQGQWANTVTNENVLMADVKTAFHATTSDALDVYASHLTVTVCSNLTKGAANSHLYLTNSLLVAVTNNGPFTLQTGFVATASTPATVFQTVGLGSYYLSTNSTYRNSGTTNIASQLLNDIQAQTTYPPKVLGAITATTNLAIQASRDTDTPDLGYHYDPLDYFASGVNVSSNVTVTLTNGVAVGIDYSQSQWGFILNSARFISQGSATSQNYVVRSHAVQERSGGNPGSRALFYDGFPDGMSVDASCEARFRFTTFVQMANDGYVLFTGQGFKALEWTHSQTFSCWIVIYLFGTGNLKCGFTNNLFNSYTAFELYGGAASTVSFRNNLFRNAYLSFSSGNTNWSVYDCLFDMSYVNSVGAAVTNGYNGYYQSTVLWQTGISNAFLTNLVYQTGPRGDFYLSANPLLVDHGSRTADQAALYWFTTATNQVLETNSIVDIGLHYIGLNGLGQPVDSDGDSVASYIEDQNGNGIVDAGESPYTAVSVQITSPTNNAVFYTPPSISINATGSAPDSAITYVEFFDGTNSLGQDSTAPYGLTWLNPSPGIHTLTARATATAGLSATSATVTITIYNALFVVGNTNLSVSDNGIKNRLLTNGFYAEVKKDSDAVSADANNKRIVVISKTVTAGSVANKFTSNAVPLLVWEDQLYDDNSLTRTNATDFGNTNGQTSVIIVNTNHPMAAGLKGTNVVVGVSSNFSWGLPTSNAVKVATLTGSNTNKIGLFGYEAGATMDKMDAPARRVGFFLGFTTSTNLNTNGWKLFDAAVQWITGTNAAPNISWVSPTNGALFTASSNVTLVAQASDNDSGIKRVVFYRNAVRIGSLTASTNDTYTLVWSNAPGGNFLMTAKAVDQGGLTSTSTQFINLIIRSNALFVVGSTNLNSGESAIKTRLENRGYVVSVKAATNAVTSDANGKTVVLISASAAATNITNKFTKVTAPVIAWQKDLFDDLGFTGTNATNFGTSSSQTALVIQDASHPLAAGLSGTPTVASNASSFSFGQPGSNAVRIATIVGDTNKVAIFGYEQGKLLVGIFNTNGIQTNALAAPGRRVGFFLTSSNASVLNSNGWGLLDAAIDWAVAKPCFPSLDVMLVVDNSASVAGKPFVDEKKAGSNFIAQLVLNQDKVGLISFAGTSQVERVLMTNFALVTSNLFALNTNSGTRLDYAINMAQNELQGANHNPAAVPIMILFSDGEQSPSSTTNLVIQAADSARAKGTRLIAIRFPGNPDGGLMQTIASPGDFYFAPDTAELTDIYNAVAETLCRYEKPPTVAITNPLSGALFTAPATVPIDATASDEDGFVISVEFFSGSNSLGKLTNAPYSITWSNVPYGVYTLKAVATDNTGLMTTSAPVSITVNQPPAVSITSPTNTQVFAISPTNIAITASASDVDGTVTQVEFFAGTNYLGVDTSSPFAFTWSNVVAGVYSLTARATDNLGAKSTSAPVVITVNAMPTVSITSPLNNTAFYAPANIEIIASAQDSDGTITNVSFYSGAAKIGEATASPYSIIWTNVFSGSYVLTAVARDNRGASATSSPINVEVWKRPPIVTILSPANNTVLAGPATFEIKADAQDLDGVVTNVQFFSGPTSLGNVTNPPYQVALTNLGAGSYTLKAVATDNDHLFSTSAPVALTITVCSNIGVLSITFAANPIMAGTNVTATVVLTAPAPPGGQAVTLSCDRPEVSLPSSVLVPAGTSGTNFVINTYTETGTTSLDAFIIGETPGGSSGAELQIQSHAGYKTTSLFDQCGPMDVAVLFDISASVGPSLNIIRNQLTNVLDSIEFASGGDYRLALVSFDTDIYINEAFAATNRLSFSNALSQLTLTGGISHEPSDEAINMVVNNLTSEDRPRQHGDFTNGFRPEARKVIVLISDEPPSGFEGDYDAGIDDAAAHWRAVEAYVKGIEICALVPPAWPTGQGDPAFIPQTIAISQDYALTTDGIFMQVDAPEWMGLPQVPASDLAFQRIISRCGAAAGQVVYVRDDLRQVNYSALALTDVVKSTNSAETALFDLSGISANVTGARFQREGQVRANAGSRFDLQFGVMSAVSNTLGSFGRVFTNAAAAAARLKYSTNWALPFSFYHEIEQSFGSSYPVYLSDRASAPCGNNYQVFDSPNSDFPFAKNVLTVRAFAKHQIPQGRCRDLVLTSSNAPTTDTWEIWLFNSIIASTCAPHGWSVEPDYTIYGGVNVCVPETALVGNSYEIRFNNGGVYQSGYFAVLPAGVYDTAPVLKTIVVAPALAASNTPITLTATLDAPARGEGAFVAFTCPAITNGSFPAYVHIPAGQRTGSVSFTAPGEQGFNVPYEITASYNGIRKTTAVIVDEWGWAPDPPSTIQVQSDIGRIRITWSPVPNALYYRVTRNWQCDFFDQWTVIGDRLTETCFYDENVGPGTNNCYQIVAVNSFGENTSICDFAPTCAQAVDALLRPLIIPNGGKFNDFVLVTISNFTAGADIYFSTNGIVPITNEVLYTGPFNLTNSVAIVAVAVLGGSTSAVSKADFIIHQSRAFACGGTTNSSLTATNWPSTARGAGYYVERFAFTGTRGYKETITMDSLDFDPYVYLIDPSGKVVAQSEGVGGWPAEIVYTLKTNGTFIIEATSRDTLRLGDFTLSLICQPSPELDVLTNGSAITNNFVLDLGITPTSQNVQRTIVLTNSGTTNLIFSSMTVGPTPPFSISPATISNLATNSSTNVVLTFNSAVTGLFSGVLSFTTDTGDNGDGVESPFVINIVCRANPPGTPPTVTLTSPTNNQPITAPTNFTVTATASATSPSTVGQVDFYAIGPNGVSILIGSDSTSPYSIVWSPTTGGNYGIKALVADSAGRIGLPSIVSLFVNDRPVAVNDRFTVYMNSSANDLDVLGNDSDPNQDLLTVTNITQATNGIVSLTNGVVFYSPSNGVYGRDFFTYTVRDARGGIASASVNLTIRPDGYFITELYTNTVDITTPPNESDVTAPTNVLGIASSDFLDYWELEYRRCSPGPSVWTLLATGTTNVQNALLGKFDPTLLPNGLYEIRITVVDLFGETLDTHTVFNVTGANKIGHFTLSFMDLDIPVAGLPITLTRTYDSRDTTSGDFGAGWKLDISSARLEKSGIMGEGWQPILQFGGLYQCVVSSEPHLISIVFPDGQVFRFTAVVSLNHQTGNDCTVSGGMSGADGAITYQALPRTSGTLQELNGPAVLNLKFVDMETPITFHEDRGDVTDPHGFGTLYDPKEFEFTSLDGHKLRFNAAGKLVKMIDRLGNSLTFNADGVIHSSGKSVKFIRNAAGFITEIYDPIGLNSGGQPNGPAAILYEYDNENNLVKVHRLTDRTDPANPVYVTTTFLYENPKYLNYLTAVRDPRGVTGIRNEFDADGRLISSGDANGKSVTYFHNMSGGRETIVDRMGNTNVFNYDSRGNVTNQVDALGRTNIYTYDADNNRTSETNPLGQTTSYTYDGNGLLLSVSNAAGTTRFTYNSNGQPLTTIDPLGQGTTNSYDASGNLVAVTNALGAGTSCIYDGSGNPVKIVDAFNRTNVTTSFDSTGHLITSSNSNSGFLITFDYDANGNQTTTSNQWVNPSNPGDIRSITNRHIFDAQNREIVGIDANGKQMSVTYNEVGAQSQITDEYGKVTKWVYDGRGNAIQVIHADGTVSQMVYDDENRLTVTDDNHLPGAVANGRRLTLDRAGQVLKSERLTNVIITITSDGVAPRSQLLSFAGVIGTNTYGYDLVGRRIATTNAFGYVTRYEYDAAGHETAVIDALTNRTDYAYDAAGRLVAVTNALGRVTQYEYDAISRAVRTIFPDGAVASTGYNAVDERVSETNQLGLVTDFEYFGSGNLSAIVRPQVFNPEGGTNARPRVEFDYDAYSRLALARDAKRRDTRFTNDHLGRLVAHKLPMGQTASQIYDSFGRLSRKVDFKGQTNELIFNPVGRIATNRFYALGSSVATGAVAYVYDAQDRISQVIEPRGTNTFQYDAQNLVTRISSPEGILNYEYEPIEGRRTRLYTTNSDLRYAYDALGRIRTVTVIKRDGVTLSTPEITTNTYTALGSLQEVYYPNGVRAAYQYDLANRLTNLVYTTNGSVLVAQYQYVPNARGQWQAATEILRQVNGTYMTNQLGWVYDNLGRLTLEKWTSSLAVLNFTNTYVYDLADNRLWKTNLSASGTEVVAYTYNTNNQLLVETSSVSGAFTNWYDTNGSLTNRTSAGETNVYAYNLQNRLALATIKRLDAGASISETVDYTTDYRGNRVRAQWSRSINGGAAASGTNVFLHEPNSPAGYAQILEELPALGAVPSVSYVLGGRVISQGKGGTISHLLPDGHGSTRQLANPNGTVTARYTLDSYGKGLDFTNSTQSPTATALLYSGEWLDPDLQQYYLRARYYLPGLGRFNQIDAFSGNQREGANLYAYCQDDPVNSSDPSGLYELDVHRYMTEYIARRVGFEEADAIAIGRGAQAPDNDHVRGAFHGLRTWHNMAHFHFVEPDGLARLASLIASNQNFAYHLGTFLHAQEDSYSHSTGQGDRDGTFYGNLGVFPNGIPLGHVLQGHRPDHTWWDVPKGMRMAWRIYQDLRHVRANGNTYPDQGLCTQDTPFNETDPVWVGMRDDLERFMIFRPNVYNPMSELGVEKVTRAGMLQKIRILFPGMNENMMDQQELDDLRSFEDRPGHPPGRYRRIPIHGAEMLTSGFAF